MPVTTHITAELAELLQQTIELRDRFAERDPSSQRYSILCRDVVRLQAMLSAAQRGEAA